MADHTIRCLFLDIGGVLLTNGWDRYARGEAAEAFGLDPEDMSERHHLTFTTYEEGKLSLEEYLRRVVFHTRRPFSEQEFRQYMYSRSEAHADTLAFFIRLKKRRELKVVAVSNEGRELTEHRIRTFDLDRLFDSYISSCFVHFRKPDFDIYRIALNTAQVRPEQVFYVDDRLLFVEVAGSLGIRGIHHTSLEKTRAALKDAGLSLAEGNSE
jgi:putative hydrolase of the HAD superfamily